MTYHSRRERGRHPADGPRPAAEHLVETADEVTGGLTLVRKPHPLPRGHDVSQLNPHLRT